MEIARLQQNVRGAFVWLTLLSAAFGITLWVLLGKIDTGFQTVNKDVADVRASVSAQTATLQSIDARLARSENRLDQRNADPEKGD